MILFMNNHEKKITSQLIQLSVASIPPMVILCLYLAISILTNIALAGIASALETRKEKGSLMITYPRSDTLFPMDFVAPTLMWEDTSGADKWNISIRFKGIEDKMGVETHETNWRPSDEQWDKIKKLSIESEAVITVSGIRKDVPNEILSQESIKISTSADAVSSPIFFREVPLPVLKAIIRPATTRWRVGYVSSNKPPRVVLEGMNFCANCHAVTPDGKTLGMDVDVDGDKGAYIVTDIERDTVFTRDKVMTWNDFRKQEGVKSFGLLSQISPDGRYIISTVKDLPVLIMLPDVSYSQLFFPIKGILVVYDRRTKQFFPLPGADDPQYVQTNAMWSPDGKWIVFARAKALQKIGDKKRFIDRTESFRYDLYRIPFNEGKGGKAEVIQGASDNGKSNYFPKFTPDGKWLIYTQSDSFMLIQPDSELHIIPADGGVDRRMNCNTSGKMNSWHSLSPSGRWMVFSSKANGPYTQLWLTHIDNNGNDTPPILLEGFTMQNRAANIPEFLNISQDKIQKIINRLD
jgi:hypothetical protein